MLQRRGDETDADGLSVFLDGHELRVNHVAGSPGRERIGYFPFSRRKDAGDVVAGHLAYLRTQGAGNGPIGINHADHPEIESRRIGFQRHGPLHHGKGKVLKFRLGAKTFEQPVGHVDAA